MNPKYIISVIVASLGMAMLPMSSFGAVILFQQDFDGTSGDTDQTIYAANSNVVGTAPVVATDPVSSGGMSGDGLKFSGSSGNSLIAANFQAVTLSNVGDYITVSYTYVATANPAGSGTNRIGLLNSGGTPLSSNMFAVPGQSSDDVGYYVTKNLQSPLPTSDVIFYKMNAGSGGLSNYTAASASIYQTNSGVTGEDTSVHTVSLTLALLAGGDMEMTYDYDGYSTNTTIVGSSLLTTTFDEFLIAPGYGSSTTMYVDNIAVTSNIPEPATFAIMLALGALAIVLTPKFFLKSSIAEDGHE